MPLTQFGRVMLVGLRANLKGEGALDLVGVCGDGLPIDLVATGLQRFSELHN